MLDNEEKVWNRHDNTTQNLHDKCLQTDNSFVACANKKVWNEYEGGVCINKFKMFILLYPHFHKQALTVDQIMDFVNSYACMVPGKFKYFYYFVCIGSSRSRDEKVFVVSKFKSLLIKFNSL